MPSLPNRGSIWRKWDLHVHTPASILNNQFPVVDGQPDWDAYVSALEATDVSVLGVTDYFTIDGYKKLREYQANGRLQGVTLLPNIEFRLDQVITRGGAGGQARRLNFHVLLSDQLTPEEIEDRFLHNLDFCYEANPQQEEFKLRLKTQNLERLGQRLIEQHAAFQGQTPLVLGASKAIVKLDDILKMLASDPTFKDKYLLVLDEIYTSGMSWDGQDHLVRKLLLQKSHFVFSGNPDSIQWHLGKSPYMEGADAFRQEFQSLKACIHGSDAHRLEEIGRPCTKRGVASHSCAANLDCEMRFCWIKADPTFEGLRQLLYEPEARVRCQPGSPAPVPSPHSLVSFKIHGLEVSKELQLAETTLVFNPQLVAIVGGRGGGKTALVDLIANCYQDRSAARDANSFVRRIVGEDPELKVELALANGDKFEKVVTDGRTYDNSELVYIAQGELEDQVTDAAALTRQIESMILGSAAVTDTVKRFELDDSTSRIEALTRQLGARNKEIVRLEDAASSTRKGVAEGAVKKKQADIEDVEKQSEAARGKLSEDRAAEAEAQQKELAALRDTAQKQAKLKELLATAAQVSRDSADEMGSVIDEINVQLKALKKSEVLPPYRYAGAEKLKALDEELRKESVATAAEIEKRSKDLATLAKDQEGLARTLDRKKKAEGELEVLQEQLAAVVRAEEQLAAARTARTTTLKDLVNAILERRRQYGEVIGLFSAKKDRLLNDLSFSAEVHVAAEEMLGVAEELLDGRSTQVRGNDRTPGVFDEYLSRARRLFVDEVPDVDGFVEEANALLERLRPKLKETRAKNPVGLHDLVFRNCFAFKPSVLYKRLSLDKLSLGQKATVLIKIHLADGTRPIIIDSHDDHLDNEFIMDELVEGIRQAKEFRQVILVSNNGNVVVNSDAEQVVVAEREGTTIGYKTGSLEDPEMRGRLVRVLEGGEAAFNQRGRKYRLQA